MLEKNISNKSETNPQQRKKSGQKRGKKQGRPLRERQRPSPVRMVKLAKVAVGTRVEDAQHSKNSRWHRCEAKRSILHWRPSPRPTLAPLRRRFLLQLATR